MQDNNKTVYYADRGNQVLGSTVTIFDGKEMPKTIDIACFNKTVVTFGRGPQNDIVLTSRLVSGEHGRFVYLNGSWMIQDKAVYQERGSTNGLICNNASIVSRIVADGDFIRIDDNVETVSEGVLFVFSSAETQNKWKALPLTEKPMLTVGRDPKCDLVLPHISVSKCHARIFREADGYYIADSGSTNGVIVNNRRIYGKVKLHEKDVIVITNSKMIFTSKAIYFCYYRSGISVDASDVVIKRGKGRKSFITCNHVNLNIKPGELVAVIGGSGAGKSTVLNAMCGYLKPAQGEVYINGVDLYQNFDSLKKLIASFASGYPGRGERSRH